MGQQDAHASKGQPGGIGQRGDKCQGIVADDTPHLRELWRALACPPALLRAQNRVLVVAFHRCGWELLEDLDDSVGTSAAIDNIASAQDVADRLAGKQVHGAQEARPVAMDICDHAKL